MISREDGWWFTIGYNRFGPYDTKKEAEEDERGLKRFYRENPDSLAKRSEIMVNDRNFVCPNCKGTSLGEDNDGHFCVNCLCPIDITTGRREPPPQDPKGASLMTATATPTTTANPAPAASPKKKTAKSSPKGSAKKGSTKKAVSKTTTKKSTGKKASNNGNPFASKLGDDAGKRIEKMYLDGKGWREMAEELGVSVSSVRFRFLNYLIAETYGVEEEA